MRLSGMVKYDPLTIHMKPILTKIVKHWPPLLACIVAIFSLGYLSSMAFKILLKLKKMIDLGDVGTHHFHIYNLRSVHSVWTNFELNPWDESKVDSNFMYLFWQVLKTALVASKIFERIDDVFWKPWCFSLSNVAHLRYAIGRKEGASCDQSVWEAEYA